MDATRLPLRDVHLSASPPWWPPAPGWWWLAAAIVLPLLAWAAWRAWRRLQRRRWARWFDAATTGGTEPQRLATASGLLRRAARRQQSGNELLHGHAWLRFLDGRKGEVFSAGAGQVLLDGGFQRELAPGEFDAAIMLARARFLELMERRR